MKLLELLPVLLPVVDEFDRLGVAYYIGEWAETLNVPDLWERVREEASRLATPQF